MHSSRPFSLAKAIGSGFLSSSRVAPVLDFLAPSAPGPAWPTKRLKRKIQRTQGRRYASLSMNRRHTGSTADAPETLLSHQPSEACGERERRSPEAWAELMDPYLPLELRSKGWLENLAAFEGVRCISTLPSLLREGRRAFPLGLLGYIAVDQDRWAAWLWLVKEILKQDTKDIRDMTSDSIPGKLNYGSGSLDELTMSPITATTRDKIPSRQPVRLEDIADPYPVEQTEASDAELSPSDAVTEDKASNNLAASLDEMTESIVATEPGVHGAMKQAVGQIWQSIAMIILEATDRADQTTEMMSFVHQAIALLHHHGWIPQSIYGCESGEAPLDLRKPPLLEILSWRIMTTLSDSAWKARQSELIAKKGYPIASFDYKGSELPGGGYQPRIRALGTATWLEFVLWSCVESSMVPDAARIINEVANRKGEKRWKIINWDALQESAIKKRRDAAKIKPGFIRWWLNNLRGISEGYSEELPLIEMEERTLSSEVIANIVDGLLGSIRDNGDHYGMRSSAVRHFINRCKFLLDRQGSNSETGFWNSVVLRLIESDHYPPASAPGILYRILDLSGREQKPVQEAGPEHQSKLIVGHSGASFGLLHQILDEFCRLGDAIGAIRTFQRIQNWASDNRQHAQREGTTGSDGKSEPTEANEENATATAGYPIPQSTVAAFLDLLTDAKEYDVGNLLLSSENVDVPFIEPRSYESSVLQPALLRFATATSNAELLKDVINRMASQSDIFSEEALRTILQCQIKLGNWPEVDKLFKHLANERGLRVEPLDIMTLAGTIIRLQQVVGAGKSTQAQLSQAQGMLKLLLRGAYRPEPDPSQPRDFSQLRSLTQCNRILASVPELEQSTASWTVMQNVQAHAPVSIPTKAFNTLLDAIVEAYGCDRGRAMFDTWCLVRKEKGIDENESITSVATPSTTGELPHGQEKPVIPNQQTVRTVLQPILRTQKASPGSLWRAKLDVSNGEKSDRELHLPGSRSDGQEGGTLDLPPTASVNQTSVSELGPPGDDPTETLVEWGIEKYREIGLADSEIKILVPGSFHTRKRGASRISKAATPTSVETSRYVFSEVAQTLSPKTDRKYLQNWTCSRKSFS